MGGVKRAISFVVCVVLVLAVAVQWDAHCINLTDRGVTNAGGCCHTHRIKGYLHANTCTDRSGWNAQYGH